MVRFFALGLLSATWWCAGCDPGISREVHAVVLDAEGKVFVGPTSSDERKPAGTDAAWQTGRVLSSGAGGTAAVQLLPGALLHVAPESQLRLAQLRLSKKGTALTQVMRRRIRLQHDRGAVTLVVRFESRAGDFVLLTPHVTLTTERGGTCSVEIVDSQTRLICTTGEFILTTGGGSSRLRAGHFRELPAVAAPRLIETDADAQREAEKCLELEQKLLNLENRKRLAPWPWRHL